MRRLRKLVRKIQVNKEPISSVIQKQTQQQKKADTAHKESFQELLKNRIDRLKFSKHALQRIQSRNISLNKDELSRIYEAVDKAAEKGVKDSLILTPEAAFIVSVKNRTVITAVDKPNIKNNVFTNIDGAVII